MNVKQGEWQTNGKGNGKTNGHGDVRHAPVFDWKELGDRIRQWRLARGLNQQQLAEASGLTQSGLYRLAHSRVAKTAAVLRQ